MKTLHSNCLNTDFIQSGSVQFFNPPSPSEYEVMRPNPISMESNTIRVGLGTTVTDSGIAVGNLVTQENTNALVDLLDMVVP